MITASTPTPSETMLSRIAANIREGWIEPERMTLNGEPIDCTGVSDANMAASRKRWASFVEGIAERVAKGEPVAFDVREVLLIGHTFTLDVRTEEKDQ